MKDFVGLIFAIMLSLPLFLAPSVYADEGVETPVIEEPETPTDPADQPGAEWDGVITDPAGENINEPAVPVEPTKEPEPQAPAAPIAPTYVAPATVAPAAPAATTAAAETPATVEAPAAETSEAAETTEATADDETTEPVPDDIIPLVPETARPDIARKIRLMALLSTAIVFFTGITIMTGIAAIKTPKAAKAPKTRAHKSSPNTEGIHQN